MSVLAQCAIVAHKAHPLAKPSEQAVMEFALKTRNEMDMLLGWVPGFQQGHQTNDVVQHLMDNYIYPSLFEGLVNDPAKEVAARCCDCWASLTR